MDDTSNSAESSIHTNADQPIIHHKKKRNRYIKIIVRSALAVTVVGVIAAVIIGGYLGFVPGLSKVLGAQTPRALGVNYSDTDYERYLAKSGITMKDFTNAPENPKNKGKKIVFADPRTLNDAIFTQEEITAAINSNGWVWTPLQNMQVRFGDDNVVEVSGNLNIQHIDEFIHFIGGVGYSESDVNKAVSWGEKFAGNAAVYVKAQASAKEGAAIVNVQELQIGRYTVPKNIANRVFQNGTNNAVARTPDFKADDVTFTNGQMHFTGTYPSTIYVKTTL